jgi:Glycosyl hydrolase family 26
MRSPLAMVAAIMVAAAAVIFAVTRLVSSSGSGATPTSLPVSQASYLGVYESGPPGTYQPVAAFTAMAGKQPNLVGYYGGWGEAFKTSFAQTVHDHGAVTLLQWDPTGASLDKIASGAYDSYLRSFAGSVRAFGHPVVIGFGHEMNAYWYSWSYRHTKPATFVAAWRHIVTLFRTQGADNVTWLWTLQADESGTGPIADWWPGSHYVTWVGIDGYYFYPNDNFAGVFGQTIAQVRMLTGAPVLLSETGVTPQGAQAAKISDLFNGMRHYGTLGLVYFDIAQHQGTYHQDWRLEDSASAEAAFRRGAAAMSLVKP